MKIPLVFEPRLEIDGERFVAQWRGRPENVRLGSFAVQAREVELRHLKQPDGAELPHSADQGVSKWTSKSDRRRD